MEQLPPNAQPQLEDQPEPHAPAARKHKAKWTVFESTHKIQVGTLVKAKFYAPPKPKAPYGQSSYRNHYYPGKVEAINEDGISCTVLYDDKAVEENVLFTSLKIYI